MAIEAIELSRTGLPEGYLAEYSENFNGALIITENGLLSGVCLSGDEIDVFKAVFNGSGKEIYRGWKETQVIFEEEGDLT